MFSDALLHISSLTRGEWIPSARHLSHSFLESPWDQQQCRWERWPNEKSFFFFNLVVFMCFFFYYHEDKNHPSAFLQALCFIVIVSVRTDCSPVLSHFLFTVGSTRFFCLCVCVFFCFVLSFLLGGKWDNKCCEGLGLKACLFSCCFVLWQDRRPGHPHCFYFWTHIPLFFSSTSVICGVRTPSLIRSLLLFKVLRVTLCLNARSFVTSATLCHS